MFYISNLNVNLMPCLNVPVIFATRLYMKCCLTICQSPKVRLEKKKPVSAVVQFHHIKIQY